MKRVAIFVDAGYLFAQGSATLTGQKRPRSEVSLNVSEVKGALLAHSRERAPTAELLRIYWYDGASSGRLSPTQLALAEGDDFKLRLGMVNVAGEQKGVDSLIVTDMIELARNGSICDAVLFSGDEDVRVGVVVAQSFGVRVHLLGISPSRSSQSHTLRMEADTLSEWDAGVITGLLSWVEPVHTTEPALSGVNWRPEIAQLLGQLTRQQIEVARNHAAEGGGLDPQIDRRLLPRCGELVGRRLDQQEKRAVRRLALNMLEELARGDEIQQD